MDDAHINRTLMEMEMVREASYEAETKAEERRLIRRYNSLWASIRDRVIARTTDDSKEAGR